MISKSDVLIAILLASSKALKSIILSDFKFLRINCCATKRQQLIQQD